MQQEGLNNRYYNNTNNTMKTVHYRRDDHIKTQEESIRNKVLEICNAIVYKTDSINDPVQLAISLTEFSRELKRINLI